MLPSEATGQVTDGGAMRALVCEPVTAKSVIEQSIEEVRSMSVEEMARRAAASRHSTPQEIANRLKAERRERAERAAAQHRL